MKVIVLILTLACQQVHALNLCRKASGSPANDLSCKHRVIEDEQGEQLLSELSCAGERELCLNKVRESRPELTRKETSSLIYSCNEKGRCYKHTRIEAVSEGCSDAFKELKKSSLEIIKALFSKETYQALVERGKRRRLEGIEEIKRIGNEYCISELNPRDPLEVDEENKALARDGRITRREYEQRRRSLIYNMQVWDKCYAQAALEESNANAQAIDLEDEIKDLVAGLVTGWSCYSRLEQSRIMCKSAQVLAFGVATGGTGAAVKVLGKRLFNKIADVHKAIKVAKAGGAVDRAYRKMIFTDHARDKLKTHFFSNKGLRGISEKAAGMEAKNGIYQDQDIRELMKLLDETKLARKKNTTSVTSQEAFEEFTENLKNDNWDSVDSFILPKPQNQNIDHDMIQTTFRKGAEGDKDAVEWVATFCHSTSCKSEGKVFKKGEVVSSYPKCGPNVFSVPRINSINFCSKEPAKKRDLKNWREQCSQHLKKLHKTCP